jgi:uncharacterized membrane protein
MKSLRPLLLVLACSLSLWVSSALFAGAEAWACGGAVMRDIDEGSAKLHEAEEALESGDVRHARRLAREVRQGGASFLLDARASRILALSFARDPWASKADLQWMSETLETMRQAEDQKSPSLDADWGEVAARIPAEEDKAFALLSSLADRDLMGSAYAFAALARLAEVRGDAALAASSRARCTTIAADPAVCGPRLRALPWPRLYGSPAGYGVPAILFAAFAAVRALRARRAARRGPDAAPWLGYGARVQVIAFVAVAVYAFVEARSPYVASLAVAFALLASLPLERRLFLRAVRKGRVAGFAMERMDEQDAEPALPRVKLFFGPKQPETLVRVTEPRPEPDYRTAARSRVPLLRAQRRPRYQSFALVTVLVVLLPIALQVVALYRSVPLD